MQVFRPTELLKAKYTKRWKGKDGKWRYEYAGAKKGRPQGTTKPVDPEALRKKYPDEFALTEAFEAVVPEREQRILAAKSFQTHAKDYRIDYPLYFNDDGSLKNDLPPHLSPKILKHIRGGIKQSTKDAERVLSGQTRAGLSDAVAQAMRFWKDPERYPQYSFVASSLAPYAKKVLKGV